MQNFITPVVPGAGPFVAIAKERSVRGDFGVVALGQAEEGGIEKVEGRSGRHDADLVTRGVELSVERGCPDGGDRAGHAEDEPSHGQNSESLRNVRGRMK